MKNLSPPPRIQIITTDNLPADGWKIYTYAAGTTTPLATYTDSTGGTANANPVVLDSYGSAAIWLNNQLYKYVVKDADDVTVWTIDNIGWNYIFADNNTWTGTNTFTNTVTLGTVAGTVTFTGYVTIDDNFYITGNLTIDGTAALNSVTADDITVPLITLSAGETIQTDTGILKLGSNTNVLVTTDVGGTPRTFDMREDGTLRISVETPANDLDVVTKGYLDDRFTTAAPPGMVAVAIGAVVSNALVSGAIGISAVAHPGSGQYTITLSSATTSTGKTIVFTTIRTPSPLRNYSAFPTVDSTTQITVKTGGGNTWTQDDRDFNIVVYSLP